MTSNEETKKAKNKRKEKPKMILEKNKERLKDLAKKEDITKLNYGIIHSQVGFADGVSIVIDQVDSVMTNELKIPKSNIYFLVGKSKTPSPYVRQTPTFWHKSEVNKIVTKHFHKGFGGRLSEKIENDIREAKEEFKKFIDEKKIDVIIVHNSSHPVNFVYSVAISRYYRDQKKKGKKTPRYIVWWHDSHLERERYQNPTRDVKNYLYEGVPGRYVDYFIFINSLQFSAAEQYYKGLDKRYKGFYNKAMQNQSIIYNTASIPISSLKELRNEESNERTDRFLKELNICNILEKEKVGLNETLFCLQHTRIVERKRIDFALRYLYKLLERLKKESKIKKLFFIISANSGDEKGNYKQKIIRLNKKLSKEHNTQDFHLIFKEDFNTSITFEETPYIITTLGGISTYFSEVEGFGNNLLEVLAAGLIPIVYTYPVFVTDIAKYGFNTVALKEFKITKDALDKTIRLIKDNELRTRCADKNIKILKRKLSHQTIAPKLKRAILKSNDH